MELEIWHWLLHIKFDLRSIELRSSLNLRLDLGLNLRSSLRGNTSVTPGRNISQIFLKIFSDFLRNFFRISQNFFKHFLRFSVGFRTLMRKWEIFPKHSFSTVFRNCYPILFLNSQRFLHHFSDFLWFLNNTLTFHKAKNENIWDFSKALIFQIFSKYLEGFFEFFRCFQNCHDLSSAESEENKSYSGKIWSCLHNFSDLNFLRFSHRLWI